MFNVMLVREQRIREEEWREEGGGEGERRERKEKLKKLL